MTKQQAELYAEAYVAVANPGSLGSPGAIMALVKRLADELLDATTGERELGFITNLELNEGDLLTLTYPTRLTRDKIVDLSSYLETKLPGVKALVLDDGPTIGVLSSGNVYALAEATA